MFENEKNVDIEGIEDLVGALLIYTLTLPLGLKELKENDVKKARNKYLKAILFKLVIYVVFLLNILHIILVLIMPKDLKEAELYKQLTRVGFKWYLVTMFIVCIPIVIKIIIKKNKQYRFFSSILILGVSTLTTLYYYLFFPFGKIVSFCYNLRHGIEVSESVDNEIPFKYPYLLAIFIGISAVFMFLIALNAFRPKIQKKIKIFGYIIISITLLISLLFWVIK